MPRDEKSWWVKMGLLDPVQFTHQAILNLRDTEKSKGINTVMSGFNREFNSYYGGAIKAGHIKPLTVTNKDGKESVLTGASAFTTYMREQGAIGMISMRGKGIPGVMIYMPGDTPESAKTSDKLTLKKILGE